MKFRTSWPYRSKILLPTIGFLLFIPQFVFAQEVASYDYTDTKPSDRLRPPLPPPPPTRLPSGMLVVGGVCEGILGNPPLSVSLVSLDRASYAFGDEFIFVLRLTAVYPTRVPVRASLAEIGPSDPDVSYEGRPMGFSVELRSPTHRTVLVGLLQLFGSKDIPRSEIYLNAGQWIEVRGKARMKWANPPRGTLPPSEEKYVLRLPLKNAQDFDARAFSSRGQSFRYDAESRQETRFCHPAEQSFGAEPVHVAVTPSPKS
ncbi:MAG: hypothetical protein DMG76_16115 [Acidobacteria bacterium]|nr:MAG: hypothetical protein DMG76_16115 [Acidobacteriota bacterium]